MAIQAIQSHSRSRILGSVERRQGTKQYYIIILASFPGAEYIKRPKPRKNTFSITSLLYDALFPGNPREYPHKPCQNLESLYMGYIVADSIVYLHSNFRGGLRKTHVFLNTVRNGTSRSSKVVDFGTNRKRVCEFLGVINSNLDPILPRFRGFLLRTTPPLFHPNFRGVRFPPSEDPIS